MANVKRSTFTETERLKLLRRFCTNSYWGATQILGYDRLTRAFHEPMMREMDLRDRRRVIVRDWRSKMAEKDGPLLWPDLWPAGERAYQKDEAEIWARDHYKTTVFIARCAKLILMYPDVAISAWHNVEEKIQETAEELGNIFIQNDDFRRLMPDIMPSKRVRRWLTATGFTVKRTKYNRHPTFYAKGAKSEVTGGHSDVGWLDDVIAQSTIDNSEMPHVRRWIGHTVTHVIRTDGGWKWGTGTRWADNDIYGDWIGSPSWDVRVRAALETEDKPDYRGASVLYDIKWIKKKQNDPETNFPNQMMNDPEPEQERLWSKGSEQFCSLQKKGDMPGAAEGQGIIVVKQDPAPWKAGSWKGIGEKLRADGTKDYWSIDVWRIRRRDDLLEYILLDGDHSLEWGEDEGCDIACGFMKKWGTNIFVSEDADSWHERMVAAARRNAVSLRRAQNGGPFKYKIYNKADRKNQAFSGLADLNRNGVLYICDTVPDEYLYGDERFSGFLTQARRWRATGKGKNNLRFDDDADNAARITDPLFSELAPSAMSSPLREWLMRNEDDHEEEGYRRSRYCGA